MIGCINFGSPDLFSYIDHSKNEDEIRSLLKKKTLTNKFTFKHKRWWNKLASQANIDKSHVQKKNPKTSKHSDMHSIKTLNEYNVEYFVNVQLKLYC